MLLNCRTKRIYKGNSTLVTSFGPVLYCSSITAQPHPGVQTTRFNYPNRLIRHYNQTTASWSITAKMLINYCGIALGKLHGTVILLGIKGTGHGCVIRSPGIIHAAPTAICCSGPWHLRALYSGTTHQRVLVNICSWSHCHWSMDLYLWLSISGCQCPPIHGSWFVCINQPLYSWF